jgi:antitoxin component YwqK of YwqJK toxin-antitoxin module
MSKSFTHAGVSKLDGKFKVRYCNDSLRTKVLIKNGHTDIDILELKHPMIKEDVVTYLLSINFDNGNKEVRAALEAEQGKREPKAPKATGKVEKVKAVKPTAKKAVKPTLESIKAKAKAKVPAKVVESEDAPF